MRRIALGIACLSVVISSGALGASPATAAAPRAGLVFVHAFVDAGAPATARYSARGVPTGGKVLLQKAVGTAGVWQKVRRLPAGMGRSVSLTAPAMGRHAYRIVIKSASGRVVAKAATSLYSFGSVALSAVLDSSESTTTLNSGTIFRYLWAGWAGESAHEEFKVDRTSCRSVTLSLASKQEPRSTNMAPATETVVQEAADPTSVSIAPNTTASLTASLRPGTAWAVDTTVPTDYFGTNSVYGNGTASCYTPNGTI